MTRMLFKKAYWEDGYRVYLSTAGTSSDPRSQVKPCGNGHADVPLSHKLYHPRMRLRILVNVPLSRAEVTVLRQGLNVAQRSADRRDFRAALVIKVRLPLWLEQPSNPRCRYQRWKRFTIACGEVAKARSVLITYGPACERSCDTRSGRSAAPR
jgi:hypothetical protein